VKVFQNFAEFKTFKTSFPNEGIFGGRLLAIKSKEFITFYDWEEFHVIRRIDVASAIKQVIWSDDGKKVIIGLEDTFYLLQFNSEVVEEVLQNGGLNDEQLEDGIEEAFTFVDEYSEVVTSG
jgi:coatomer subunit beta'